MGSAGVGVVDGDRGLDQEIWDLAVSVLPDAERGLSGFTALHYAASRGHHEAVSLLLSAGASPSVATRDGDTALHLACDGGHFRTARLLLDFGADTEARSSSSLDETPLFSAARGNSPGHEQCVRLLLASGCDECARNRIGETASEEAEMASIVGMLGGSSDGASARTVGRTGPIRRMVAPLLVRVLAALDAADVGRACIAWGRVHRLCSGPAGSVLLRRHEGAGAGAGAGAGKSASDGADERGSGVKGEGPERSQPGRIGSGSETGSGDLAEQSKLQQEQEHEHEQGGGFGGASGGRDGVPAAGDAPGPVARGSTDRQQLPGSVATTSAAARGASVPQGASEALASPGGAVHGVGEHEARLRQLLGLGGFSRPAASDLFR